MGKKEDFIFIVGCPRSGTTLLSLMIETALDIAIPVETHFIPLFYRWIWMWGDLSKATNRSILLQNIYDFLELWTPRALRGRDITKTLEFSLLATREQANAIIATSMDYATLVRALFSAYAQLRGKKSAGDKSAFYSHVPLATLDQSVPNSKFIHIVRDGRDVALSWQNIWCGPQSLDRAARLWARHVIEKREWGDRHPKQYLELRYEDLITDHTKSMARISTFLDQNTNEFNLSFNNNALAKLLSEGDPHPLIATAINQNNKEKWRQSMAPDENAAFLRHASTALETFDYALTQEAAGTPLPQQRKTSATGSVFGTRASRFFKPCLPPALYLTSKLGINLQRLLNK